MIEMNVALPFMMYGIVYLATAEQNRCGTVIYQKWNIHHKEGIIVGREGTIPYYIIILFCF